MNSDEESDSKNAKSSSPFSVHSQTPSLSSYAVLTITMLSVPSSSFPSCHPDRRSLARRIWRFLGSDGTALDTEK
ncbi:MAG TPA: hypothetical protein VK738_21255 [Terriglobales bacterium]|nr:hypothetical protein [Terriglobales bacterium]